LELQLKFEWDEHKNLSKIRNHRMDLADVEEIFNGPTLTVPDLREDYGEDRWIVVGLIRGTAVVAVVAERESKTLRVISLRKATGNEQNQYAKEIQNRLETN
jgi:uncharacterized DUF497 family protein